MSNEQGNTQTREQQIIESHKKAVIFTGKISDFHVENLKKWPFIIFGDKLESVSIDYDFNNTDASLKYDSLDSHISSGYIEYDLKIKKGCKIKDVKKKLNILENWVKNIFWKETEVKFKRNGRKWQVK